ncbi:MAG: D-alanyl-D-alanine carboxypeptidase family protein [Minisyncoccia bacterium]
MKKDMLKKIIVSLQLVFLIFSFFVSTNSVLAVECTGDKILAPDGVSCVNATQENDLKYNFLAPLPCEKGTPGCEDGQLKTFDPTSAEGENSKIGEYLNIMIRIFIGICAVLAVIMIVVGGLEYMTSELISNKENGKHRITGAIFGLVLALGAWTILNQINPDILKTDLSSLEKITVEVTLADAIASDSGNPPGVTSGCSAGVVKTQISMFACKDIVSNINAMLVASKSAGLNITGGGYRSTEQQKQLRIKYCNGDYENASAKCNPPTALPGQSNHNHGKAFDLQCDGKFIQTRDNKCFVWLQANAGKYGLSNLPSEPWHWSVDGR